MQLTVNGESQSLPNVTNIRELIEHLSLTGKPVAVEVNGQVVPRREHEAHALDEGDAIELVTLVGGG